MTSSTALLDVELRPGKPPLLQIDEAGAAARWAAEHRGALRSAVTEHGALLVRGLRLADVAVVEAVFRQLGRLMIGRETFAARRRYAEGVYAATPWPAKQQMCMHHELSYATEVPGLMMFACLEAPARDGATPLADAPSVLDALPASLVERCERDGWLLIRNYNEDIGASLVDAFGTDDRGTIEGYCRAHAIEFEWRAAGVLRTRQHRRAVVRHPVTGRPCWFNQIAFLNEWTLAPELREYLVDQYGADGLPFNTRFGDGEPVGLDVVETINEVYDAHTVYEPWQAGDLLVVDNVRTAHGRQSYDGPRDVVVAMADAVRLADFSPAVV